MKSDDRCSDLHVINTLCEFSPDLLLEARGTVLQNSRGLRTVDEGNKHWDTSREMVVKRRPDAKVRENFQT